MTNSNSICNKRIRMSDQILKGLIYAAAGIAILILIGTKILIEHLFFQ